MKRQPKPITADEVQAQYEKAIIASMPQREIDESARSNRELRKLLGYEHAQMDRIIDKKIEAGEWERVWKHGKRCLIPAYRPKKK